jgi:predicted nuclease with TOPRIM domain
MSDAITVMLDRIEALAYEAKTQRERAEKAEAEAARSNDTILWQAGEKARLKAELDAAKAERDKISAALDRLEAKQDAPKAGKVSLADLEAVNTVLPLRPIAKDGDK